MIPAKKLEASANMTAVILRRITATTQLQTIIGAEYELITTLTLQISVLVGRRMSQVQFYSNCYACVLAAFLFKFLFLINVVFYTQFQLLGGLSSFLLYNYHTSLIRRELSPCLEVNMYAGLSIYTTVSYSL